MTRVDLKVIQFLIKFQSENKSNMEFPGAIRESGGILGKKEQGDEAHFFHKQQQEQLKKLKDAGGSKPKSDEAAAKKN